MNDVKIGGVGIWLDEIVPCLKDTETGEIKETVVFKIESRSFLKKFNEKNGWGINWIDIPNNVEVFALALKENNEIQGLVEVKNDKNSIAAYIHWACTAPHNNKLLNGSQKYTGVGGHLFAIAADKSIQWGYEGAIHGFALNKKLLKHYIEVLGAIFLGALHAVPKTCSRTRKACRSCANSAATWHGSSRASRQSKRRASRNLSSKRRCYELYPLKSVFSVTAFCKMRRAYCSLSHFYLF